MYACAAVHLRWVFPGKDVNLHNCTLLFESDSRSVFHFRPRQCETHDCCIRVMTIVRCIQYHLQMFRDVCNDSASDGGPVLIKVRIVPRIARSEEQTDHTYREDRGNRGDEPHRMLWQPHDHEKGDGRQRNQHPAGHTEPLAGGMRSLEHLRIRIVRVGRQQVFDHFDRATGRLPRPVCALLQPTGLLLQLVFVKHSGTCAAMGLVVLLRHSPAILLGLGSAFCTVWH
nr:MAG TPA: hypothetical protein [Caudoviricetes sp.]DAH85963.1 MAG TPA: hypothetical protein [Caudoviricetes sp.]